jgi:long-chain-fatty-acid--CoA ligase ACSBG
MPSFSSAAIAGGLSVAGYLVSKQLFEKAADVASEAPHHSSPTSEFANYRSRNFKTTDKTAVLDIRYSETGFGSEKSCPATTLPQLLKKAAALKGDRPVISVETPCPELAAKVADGDWQTWTYASYFDEIKRAARGMLHLGLKRFDGVSIYGFNSPQWIMGELGAICAGGIAAGIYPTDTPEMIEYKANHSDSSIFLVQDEAKAKLVLSLNLPCLRAIVIWAPSNKCSEVSHQKNVTVCTWEYLISTAAKNVSEEDLDSIMESQEPGGCCAYIYTSGTTGNPKAVMISHDNIVFESCSVIKLLKGIILEREEEERIISFLPLSHVAGMMVDIVCPIVAAARTPGWIHAKVARPYDLSKGTLGDRLRAVKPTMFLGVPRVWEKIMEKIVATVKKNPSTGLKKIIADFGKKTGLKHAQNCQLGGSGVKPIGYPLARKLVAGKLRKMLGLTDCKYAFTGAAPITEKTLNFFGMLGIQINEVYGMSECTGATTFSTDHAHVWGSCGWQLESTEVAIFAKDSNSPIPRAPRFDGSNIPEQTQGEVCFRGRHIMMGYMANPKLGADHTNAMQKKLDSAIDDQGWLHSGDKGCMSERGMVKITGRFKELIIGAGGENVAPVPVEDRVKELCPAISNIMMVGDKRKFNTALITLQAGGTGNEPGGHTLTDNAATLVPGVSTIAEACESEDFIQHIIDAIDATNKDQKACPSNAARIQRFTILPLDFSVATGELTATLKLKRSVVDKKHQNSIERMYSASRDMKFVPYNNM